MKYILSLIISGALVVSGFGQTRNVLVGTNNAVVQPTNFWSADASNARTGLGLGTAATSSVSAFQPASTALSNLATGNGGALSNLQATNLVGIIPASNISTVTFTNIGGTLAISSGGTGATNAVNARQNLGSTIVGDAVFIATNAAAARTALSLGTAAISSATDFQPADSDLTNLANNNAINLTNFPPLLLRTNGNGAGLTNLTAANISGAVAIANGGTGATNATNARNNLGLGSTNNVSFNQVDAQTFFVGDNGAITFESSSASGASRTNLGLGAGSTNEVGFKTVRMPNGGVSFIEPVDNETVMALPSDTDPVTLNPIHWNNSGVRQSLGFSTNLGSFWTATNIATARSNLGLGLASSVAFSNLTLSNGVTTNLALSLGSTNRGFYATAGPERIVIVVGGIDALQIFSNSVETATGIGLSVSGLGIFSTNVQIGGRISFSGVDAVSNAAATRTNLGIGWSALTNSNAGTSLVSVNTNGDVVSPTNFWQAAPISTTVQYQTNVTGTSTNAATNSRNLFLFSLSPSVSGITNTVTLPTNTATTFEGDRATITHLAQTTNAVTAIRQLGAATNLIALNQLDETVLLMYRSGAWRLADNISYVEPIFFSGTNAAANTAASRTNLGLGATNEVQFGKIFVNGVFEARSNVVEVFQPILITDRDSTNAVFQFETESDSAIARTNLKIPLTALTNTNNANFQAAVFTTNAAPTNSANVNTVNFNTAVHWLQITVPIAGTNQTFRIPLFQ